jgi:hypothetical protein
MKSRQLVHIHITYLLAMELLRQPSPAILKCAKSVVVLAVDMPEVVAVVLES